MSTLLVRDEEREIREADAAAAAADAAVRPACAIIGRGKSAIDVDPFQTATHND